MNKWELSPEEIAKLADDHVDWLLNIMRPLLISEFIHGYKHGKEGLKSRYEVGE